MDVCGNFVVVAHGKENIDVSKAFDLNESAAYLWQKVQDRDFEAEDLADFLTEEYEVDKETALRDARKMMRDWKEAGLAE